MMCSCWARANGKQLLLAATVFVFIYAMLLHGMILEFTYQATAQLWCTEADMQANMLWLMLAQERLMSRCENPTNE